MTQFSTRLREPPRKTPLPALKVIVLSLMIESVPRRKMPEDCAFCCWPQGSGWRVKWETYFASSPERRMRLDEPLVAIVAAKRSKPCTSTYDRPRRSKAYCRRFTSTVWLDGLSEPGVRR